MRVPKVACARRGHRDPANSFPPVTIFSTVVIAVTPVSSLSSSILLRLPGFTRGQRKSIEGSGLHQTSPAEGRAA